MQKELQKKVKSQLQPLFSRYHIDFQGLESVLKWKPIVLIIGNYSSGKSTLINEMIGQNLQRTGQSPTDDSFTVITWDDGEGETEVPGANLVNDESLPFTSFKAYGKRFISHFCMKRVKADFLKDMVIIDSPGMLDSVAEKDRGYNYMTVLGEFAKLADLIVLMFDPHKAGTIKETYSAIRTTLPESSGEDRIIFVMNRIDECDHLSDLVRSYGTLCWNISQMTGRKDIPYIYLTYAPQLARSTEALSSWEGEREALKEKILQAPSFRLYHILEDVDRQVNELALVSEAMASFAAKVRRKFYANGRVTLLIAVLAFFLLGPICKVLFDTPKEVLISAILDGSVAPVHFLFPLAGALVVMLLSLFWFTRFTFPGLKKKWMEERVGLVSLDTEYKKNLWQSVEANVRDLVSAAKITEMGSTHSRNLRRIRRFLDHDLKNYYKKIK